MFSSRMFVCSSGITSSWPRPLSFSSSFLDTLVQFCQPVKMFICCSSFCLVRISLPSSALLVHLTSERPAPAGRVAEDRAPVSAKDVSATSSVLSSGW